jgi:predicted alpha-1,6-mannanase (GH76 family)
MRHRTITPTRLLAVAALAAAAVIAPQPSGAVALTDDQATRAFHDFVDVYWDDEADYFFTYSDREIHPEHAHGPQAGLYTDYWWEAQLWEMVMDRYERSGDPVARSMIDDVWSGFQEQYPDFRANDWNDDIGWWAQASTRAYALTGDPQYLSAAQDMFAHVAAFEDETYGGGIWWKNVDVGDGERNQKNVATNGPAVVTAMRLYAATGDPEYRETAVRLYDWMSLTFDREGKVADHVHGDSEVVDWDWTYNQGNLAAAALELYLDGGDEQYLADATRAADWAVDHLTSSGTFLREGTGDGGGFKAVLTRTLRALADEAGQEQYEAVLTTNASQAARQVNAEGIGGYDWTAPAPPPGTEAVQSLAAGATVAVLQQAEPDGHLGVVEGTGVYEAENAERSGIDSESTAAGFSGRGYLAGWAADGTSVTFHVHVAEERAYPLHLRYSAAAGPATRTLSVDGRSTLVDFPATSGWNAWSEVVVPVDLSPGHNAVVLALDQAAGSREFLNLDRLVVDLAAPEPEPEPEPTPEQTPVPAPSPSPIPDPGASPSPSPSPADPGPGTGGGGGGAPTPGLVPGAGTDGQAGPGAGGADSGEAAATARPTSVLAATGSAGLPAAVAATALLVAGTLLTRARRRT